MKDIRPRIDDSTAARVLEGCVGEKALEVSRVSSGLISATFQCLAQTGTFIVQFNEPDLAEGLTVERRFKERLRKAGVPLREVIGDGMHEGLKWTVTKKAPGKRMTSLDSVDYEAALPSVFDTLLAISGVDVSDWDGYGWFNENGQGMWETWAAHLFFVQEEEPEGMFYGSWHSLFDTTFLERGRFEEYFSEMARLSKGLSPPRQLVHGGFGYDNVLVEKRKVSAVLDWQDARFGDSLLDLAYADFWPSGFDLTDMFQSHCEARGVRHDDYHRRVRCYKYYIGLDAMRFFAKTDNRDAYDQVLGIVEDLGC
jgi:hygromycin-B 4-O-kinase